MAATGWQAYVASDNETRSLRAYVGPVIPKDGPLVGGAFWPPNLPKVTAGINNFGQTPAYNVTSETAFGFKNYPLSEKTDFVIPPASGVDFVSDDVIYPQTLSEHDLIQQLPAAITKEQLAASDLGHVGSQRLIFWGTMHYKDVFGAEHHSNFCYGLFHILADVYSSPCNIHNDGN